MKRLAILVAGCIVGVTACSTRVPTDSELVTLLHRDGVTSPTAGPDAMAVHCLRSWSGDASLTKDQMPVMLTDAFKAHCRSTIDGWIADGKRNPAKFDFAQISSPEIVRRAMALLAVQEPKDAAAPGQVAAKPAAPRTRPEPGPAPDIDATLAHSADLCKQAKEMTAQDKSDVRLVRYADYCSSAAGAAVKTGVDRMKAINDTAGIEQTARRVAQSNSVVEGLIGKHKN